MRKIQHNIIFQIDQKRTHAISRIAALTESNRKVFYVVILDLSLYQQRIRINNKLSRVAYAVTIQSILPTSENFYNKRKN